MRLVTGGGSCAAPGPHVLGRFGREPVQWGLGLGHRYMQAFSHHPGQDRRPNHFVILCLRLHLAYPGPAVQPTHRDSGRNESRPLQATRYQLPPAARPLEPLAEYSSASSLQAPILPAQITRRFPSSTRRCSPVTRSHGGPQRSQAQQQREAGAARRSRRRKGISPHPPPGAQGSPRQRR